MANLISKIPGVKDYIRVINSILDLDDSSFSSIKLNLCDTKEIDFGQIRRVKSKNNSPNVADDLRVDITIRNDSTCGAHLDLVHTLEHHYVVMYAPFNNSCATNLPPDDNPEMPSDLPFEIQEGIRHKKCRIASFDQSGLLSFSFRRWLTLAITPVHPSILSFLDMITMNDDILKQLSCLFDFNAQELSDHGIDYSMHVQDLSGKHKTDTNISDRIDDSSRWLTIPFSPDTEESFILYVVIHDEKETKIPLFKITVVHENIYAEGYDGNSIDKSRMFVLSTRENRNNSFSFNDCIRNAFNKLVKTVANAPLKSLTNNGFDLLMQEKSYASKPIVAITLNDVRSFLETEMSLLHDIKTSIIASNQNDPSINERTEMQVKSIFDAYCNASDAFHMVILQNRLFNTNLYPSNLMLNKNCKIVISRTANAYSHHIKKNADRTSTVYAFNTSITVFVYDNPVATISVSADPKKSTDSALIINNQKHVKVKWYQAGTSAGEIIVELSTAVMIVSKLIAVHVAVKDVETSAINAISRQSEYTESDKNNLHISKTFNVEDNQGKDVNATMVFESNYNAKTPLSVFIETSESNMTFSLDKNIDKSKIVPNNMVMAKSNEEVSFKDLVDSGTLLDGDRITFGDYFDNRILDMSQVNVGYKSKNSNKNAVSAIANKQIQDNAYHTQLNDDPDYTKNDMLYKATVAAMAAYTKTFDPYGEGLITFDDGRDNKFYSYTDSGDLALIARDSIHVSKRRNANGLDIPYIYSVSVGSHHDGSTVGGSIVTIKTNGKNVAFAQFDGHNERPITIGADGKLTDDFVDWYIRHTGIRSLKVTDEPQSEQNPEASDFMSKMFDVKEVPKGSVDSSNDE